jgi:Caspase domain
MYHFLIGEQHCILQRSLVMVVSSASVDRLGFNPRDIIRLTDEARDPRYAPTRTNILGAMRWLVRGARKHDSLFFHCMSLLQVSIRICQRFHVDSGHGAQIQDQNGDEVDGFDEGNIKGFSSYPPA